MLLSLFLVDSLVIVCASVKLKIFTLFRMKGFSSHILKRFFFYGIPIVGVAISTWNISLSDRYIIHIFRSSREVGLYAISYDIANKSFSLIFMIIMLGAFPIIINTWSRYGRKITERLISSLLRYYFIIIFPLFIIVTLLSKEIIEVLAAPNYLEGYWVLPWVALGTAFWGLALHTNKVWELTENTTIIFALGLMAALLNLILNFIFVPKYGFKAAAITTTTKRDNAITTRSRRAGADAAERKATNTNSSIRRNHC